MPTVTVSPGGEATTTLSVRNDSDIVEAYTLEVVGDCAAWSTVEPARVSLYPGTSETVTVRLAPPRSPDIRAGEVPLGVRVLPAEHPESVAVSETTVHIEPFLELRTELQPRRRRGWLAARYRLAVRNEGNTAIDVEPAGKQPGEELKFGFTPQRRRLEPGESAETGLRVRAPGLIWFGTPTTWPFELDVTATGDGVPEADPLDRRRPLDGEFVQVPVLPRWLLAVLAALLALLIAWFALVRPAVRSTAQQAATEAAREREAGGAEQQGDRAGAPGGGSGGQGRTGGQGQGQGQEATAGTGTGPGTGGGPGADGGPGTVPGSGQQSSSTIDVQTDGGARKVGTYQVPAGKVFGITDLVVANFQGDEGLLTLTFGDSKVTTIALETFRNQDYHWVTPIKVTENATVTAAVTCAKPGTPATGRQASGCHQVVNLSGVLSDLKR
ncbi:COG1470 family protein [Streptomyces sp. URMC 123]|uniref:COG1470 family protein n=1 Tax=Streptomyces sp. URMC 123 TaxID=3423403 RepID=UPI003F1A0CD0